jgi:phosphinothricin acetyltransferase
VLSRQRDETVMIGDDIEVTVVDIRGDKVRLGITAPKQISVHRKEVYDAIRRENRAASRLMPEDLPVAKPSEPIQRRLQIAPPPVKIRLATEADLETINRIYNHYVVQSACTYQEEPSTAEERTAWFTAHGPRHPVTVAERDGEVVGWGSLSKFHPRSAYGRTVENSVYVRKDCHRQGIGVALLGDLLERGRAIGHHCVVALIDSQQRGSVVLHEKFGFVEVGRLREVGFKFGRAGDVVYMQRML